MQKKWLKQLKTVFLCGLCFYLVSRPFRWFFTLNAATEVRPASALPPVFGMLFGVPGALGAAIANAIGDIQSRLPPGLIAVGFFLQFLYGYMPRVMWDRFPLKSEKEADVPRMDSTAHIVKFLVIAVVNSVCMAVSLGILIEAFGLSPFFSLGTLAILLNNVVFTILLGMPLVIAWSFRQDKHLSLNARVALFCLLLGFLESVMVGYASYSGIRRQGLSPLVVWNTVYFFACGAFIAFFLVSLIFMRNMEKQVTIPAEGLADAAKDYLGDGIKEPDHRAFLQKCQPLCYLHSEMGTLARSSARMVHDLQNYMIYLRQATADRERINTELNVATQIQASMLPHNFPDRPELSLFATMNPAKEVGGDFYDFFLVDEDHLALVIADVSGKGIPAAMFMVTSKNLLKNTAKTGASPKEILEKVNQQLCENNEAEMFVTVWMGILEISTGKMTCANAGHEFPAICRAGGQYELLKDRHGFVLAGMEFTKYREYQEQLYPGDRLYVYTDGVPEATNGDNELFGTDRMLAALNQNPQAEPETLLRTVRRKVDQFVGDAPQFDDMTMLGMVYRGPNKKGGEENE